MSPFAPTIVFAATVLLAGCGTTQSTTFSSVGEALSASPASSASATPLGLTATTEPADAPPAGATKVSMSMFRFQPSAITVKAGTVVFFLDNTDGVFAGGPGTQHSLSIGSALDEPLAASAYVHTGAPAVFTVEGLVPGRYVIWCAVPGHADHGMVGTLTVKP